MTSHVVLRKVISATVIMFIAVYAFTSHAAVPSMINYQGILKNSSGVPVSGTVSMTFSLYSSLTDTVSLWAETQPSVNLTNGRYSVALGSVTPIGLAFDTQYYLGVQVGTDPEMTPRSALASVGYAMVAGSVTDGAITAAKIGENCADGEFLVKSPTGWSCGSIAQFPNSIGSCVQSTCKLACASGYSNCNGVTADGCEINTASSLDNCGQCGNSCPTPANATRTCETGTCGLGTCNAGWSNCNGATSDGCEINVWSNINNCGNCGVACSSSNIAAPSCTSGFCTGACNAGFADCNANKQVDGCETNVSTSASDCGGCGIACSGNNIATPSCAGGLCNGACNAGYADCNGNKLSDGCEINIGMDANNCGSCGDSCSSNHISSRTCAAGSCTGTCSVGYGDCNGNKRSDGCETELNSNPVNCGGCGIICSSTNISSPLCASGLCNGACNADFADCNANKQVDGCETNVSTSAGNCGGCGIACSGNNIAIPSCAAGVCNGACSAGFADCNGNKLADGCETNVLDNINNCGSCGNQCSSNNGTPSCTAGSCGIVCSAGYADCDGNPANGCEAYLNYNNKNCGACGIVCAAGNHCDSSGSCVAGSCTDADGDGFCSVATGGIDCNDFNSSVYPGAAEVCDGVDNNCNGQVDEGLCCNPSTWYQDADGDGYGNPGVSVQSCTQPAGYVANNIDCDDTHATVRPGASEICDGIDNNCDGQIDEGFNKQIDPSNCGTCSHVCLSGVCASGVCQ